MPKNYFDLKDQLIKEMKQFLNKSLLFALVLGALVFNVSAQQGAVSGVVTDPNGDVIAGVSVTIVNVATNAKQTATTSSSGTYLFPSLSPGVYDITFEANGLETIKVEKVTLETATRFTRNVTLAAKTLTETVTVDGEGIAVNTTDGSVGNVVNRRFVENIPLNGRSFQSLMTLTPGVSGVPSSGVGSSGGISVNGQRTEANYFTVDGVSANTGLPATGTPGFGAGFAGATPGDTAIGTTHSLVSIDALQEFKAATSTFSAEYGRSPGGQFIMTTRPGTNRYAGSLYTYFRNDIFDANNFFGNATGTPKPATRQFNFGGTFSGPLPFFNFGENDKFFHDGRDRTFFFVSYEGMRLRTPQSGVQTQVPSLALRQNAAAAWQPFLNAFAIPNGPDLGNGLAVYNASYSNPSEIDNLSVRIDHRINDRFSLFGRYSDTPSENTTRMLTNVAQTLAYEFKNRSITVGSSMIFTPTLVNDLRVAYTDSKSNSRYNSTNFGGAVPYNIGEIPTVNTSPDNRVNIALNFGGRPSFSLLNQTGEQNQWNIVNTLSAPIGSHNLKFGVDFRRTESALTLPPRFMPINVASQAEFINNTMTNFNLVIYSLDKLRPVYKNLSLFAQDEWKVNRRLSLSYGVRYEVNPAPEDANGQNPYNVDQIDNLATTRLITDSSRPLWKTTWNNFAPRIGAAFVLFEKTGYETVIRGGGGMFYDLGNTQASDGYGRAGFRRTTTFHGNPFPLTSAQVNGIPAPNVTTPYTETILTDDPELKLPYTLQWNGSIEQSLGSSQTFTVSYIGAAGRRLLVDRSYLPRPLGNLNFSANAAIVLTKNEGRSDYHALQAQYQRRLRRGLQASASYTWAHSTDNATSNFTVRQLTKGDSDFDIRHNFQAALSYDIPGNYENALAAAVLKNWAIDTRVSARTALPVNIIGASGIDPAVPYLSVDFQPNVVAGQPFYIDDASAPGGRRINLAAFAVARNSSNALVQGDLGRNSLRGFGSFQTDLAIRRNFPIGERFRIQFRAESFNLFNHANFGAIENRISVPATFGRAINTQNAQLGGLNSLYQVGGPRSFQFALKLMF